ncbi:hypothetical protein [Methylomagnum sp.]
MDESWLHEPEEAAKLAEAIAWAEANPPRDNFAEIEARIMAGVQIDAAGSQPPASSSLPESREDGVLKTSDEA